MALINLYYNGIKCLSYNDDSFDLVILSQWPEKFFPLLVVLFYTLPLAWLVILMRKLNFKQKLLYLITGIAIWFHITCLPGERYYSWINQFTPLDNGINAYEWICRYAYWHPFDESLRKRMDEREKKNQPKKEKSHAARTGQ
jgi:hypothetical protein